MITPQSSHTEILEYQRVLQRAGRYLGPLDGIWGPGTQRAHEAYQAALVAHQAPANETPEASNAALAQVRDTIIATAEHFLNLTETAPNAKWDDLATAGPDHRQSGSDRGAELRQALLETGWQLGWAYCIAFAEVCWRAAYRQRPELPLITRSITPSVIATFENFNRLGRITRTPVVGAIMFLQHGDGWQGHAGIVTELLRSEMAVATIEGNTSSSMNTREGDGVYRKKHPVDFTKRTNGLWLRGFVNPFLL